ncbi:hypothetical protein D9611_013034 [Ephemerocybe angulata]|uniref:CHAT domain-containing protein n=1 Tax=Ephemerocybe angulata TaxID=980116 RepID=A0A8H5ESZ5_9AGAR|nr:hypothetical protein D9611_013034 [Tulosesus angulatus]
MGNILTTITSGSADASIPRKAVELTLEGHLNMAFCLNRLGNASWCRFQRTEDVRDLSEAILAQQRAVELTPEEHPDMSSRLDNLGLSLQRRFQRIGDIRDISEAILAQQRAVHLTPEGHPKLPSRLSRLGVSFGCRFHLTGDLCDISEAILAQQRVVELTPEGHSEKPSYMINLGISLNTRFQHTGDLRELSEAISVQQRAVDLTPQGHSSMPLFLHNLGISLQSRFHHTGDLLDISEAILAQKQGVELTPEGHSNLPSRLSNLGNSLDSRFQRTGDLRDISEAISTQQRAIELAPAGHWDIPSYLINLGISLRSRFQHTGDLYDISEAILAQQRAVDLTPEGHPDMPSRLENLGISLQRRFQSTGDLRDISGAILAQQRAVHLTPEGHPKLPSWLSSLGVSLGCRFHRSGDLSDLSEAILAQRRAVDLTPTAHSDIAPYLTNLGVSLRSRFQHTGDLPDLSEAILTQKRAVDLMPEGHSGMPLFLYNLGISLQRRFQRIGDLSDLSEAILAQKRAVELTPEGHSNMPSRLSNLGNSLHSRFQRTGDNCDIYEAISSQQRSVELAPEGHSDVPSYLTNLGISLLSRFERTKDPRDLAEVISAFRSSATSDYGAPRIKLEAAEWWAESLNLVDPPSPAIMDAFDTIICLIALTATLEQTLQDRYTHLQETSGLPLKAASTACSFDRVDKALEWLEQGRCLVWGQLTNLRTPLDDLRLHDEHLADSIMEVSRQLDTAGSSRTTSGEEITSSERVSLAEEARDHVNLARQWDDLLAKVRANPGFENFLKPSPWYTLLQHLPELGYVVVINVDERRCDAIALLAGQDKPLHIPLPDFSLAKCNEYRMSLSAQLRSHHLRDRGRNVMVDSECGDGGRGIRSVFPGGKDGESIVQGILRGLWCEVVKPILQALEMPKVDRSSASMPPRIWWCPTGSLSFLPLHAAGIYRKKSSETILDYAVSSYTPTVTALTERVKNGRTTENPVSGLFMTSQPNAPGSSPIPGTTTEVQSIYKVTRAAKLRVKMIEGGALTVAQCLDSMEAFNSIHLACHASQDAADPLKSRFLFHDGPLELATILQRNLKNADLAFLSACQTSTGEEKLSDEAVHLAAGMLAAGYRRVVATMWSIGDRHAPDVAANFYQYLLDHRDLASGSGFDGAESANALHHAIQQLRLQLGDYSDQSLLAWIPYVHYGY